MAKMTEKSVVVSDDVAWRTIEGEARIITVADSRLHHLDKIGTFVWEHIAAGTTTAEELATALVRAFRVMPDVARADIEELLDELERLGLVLRR